MRANQNAILATIVAIGVVVVGGVRAAEAGEVAQVVSGSRQKGELFDLHLSVGWWHESRSAAVKREEGNQATGGQIGLRRDLVYRQARDLLRMRADVGLWRDLSVFAELPLVLGDERSLRFDRGVDASSATILRDGIVRAGPPGSTTLFEGPKRQGVEYVGVGASWAILNQDRDGTQPTWIVRAEARFALGNVMRFDPLHPEANTAVGPGYHQLVFSTIFARRRWALEPYVAGFYLLPLAGADSPVGRDVLGKAAGESPQHRAGGDVGVEAVLWVDPRSQRQVSIELGGRLELRMLGLAQAELWEPLSGSAACPKDPATCRAGVDRDLDGNGTVEPNPGTTRTPGYGVFGGHAGLAVRAGRFVRFRALGGMTFEQDHLLSDGRAGNDVYDIPGRRFRLEDGRAWNVLVEGGLVF